MFKEVEENVLLTSSKFLNQKDYWINKLSGDIPGSELLIKKKQNRGIPGGTDYDHVDIGFPEELCKKIMDLGRNSELSIYIILLTGLKALIYRCCNNSDVIVISPVLEANVTADTINKYLYVRDWVEGHMTCKDLLIQTRQSLLEAYENQDYPTSRIMECLLNTDSAPAQEEIMISETVCLLTNIHDQKNIERINNKLVFSFEKQNETISGSILFDPGVYETSILQQMAIHLVNLLEGALIDINTKVFDISFLTGREKKQLLDELNHCGKEFPNEKRIHQLFEEQVRKTPDKIALVFEQQNPGINRPKRGMEVNRLFTYKELNKMANQLASVLSASGVSPGSIVGLMANPSIEMMVGIWGILKAGGALLPIDPTLPGKRIGALLRDCHSSLLLTGNTDIENPLSGLLQNLHLKASDQDTLRILKLDDFSRGFSREPGEDLDYGNRQTDLAYVIFTSGSTGKPKGVPITHRNVIPLLLYDREFFALGEDTRVMHNLSFTFDYGLEELFTTLMFGGTLYFSSQEKLTYPEEFVNFVNLHDINTLHTTPAFFRNILRGGQKMPGMGKLHFGGEKLTQKLVDDAVKQAAAHCIVYNGYGPTEASICAIIFPMTPSENHPIDFGESIPIGKPCANNLIYILDPGQRLLPMGAAGEICIGGVGVAPGYLNQPELTLKNFINNPYHPDDRLYLTGDLARWLPDGNIEFLGRIDTQVNLRGYRIELGEIENQLLTHENISEAVAVLLADNEGESFLCAYYIPGPARDCRKPGEISPKHADIKVSELREYLSQRLPNYMVPSIFVPLDKIPLTTNGKVDKKALPPPQINGTREYAPPGNETEEKLARIWSEVLGIEKDIISIDANFFELGGHSLKATILLTKMHKAFHVKVPLVEIFQTPTIRGLAKYIKEAAKKRFLSIEPAELKEYYPLSSAQKRMFVLQLLDETNTSYNSTIMVILEGAPIKERLEAIFKSMIHRHEILRTSFEIRDGQPVQRIHDEVEFEIEYDDLATGGHHSSFIIHHSFVRPFDLSRAPLLRVGLIKCQEAKQVLMLDMHHITIDGISWMIFIRELMNLYSGIEVPTLRVQYRDFSEWQREFFKSPEIKKQKEYWLKELSGEIPLLNLPIDFPRPVVQDFTGTTANFEIPIKETSRLNHLAKEENATLFMVLLAIFYILLAKISGQEDIIVGTPLAGRRHTDLEQMIGMFANTLVLRHYPTRTLTFKAFLREVKQRTLAAYENQDVQFEDLVEMLVKGRDTSRNPLFDVMFALETIDVPFAQPPNLELTDLKFIPYSYERKTSNFDLALQVEASQNTLNFSFLYRSRLFKKSTVDMLIHYFKNVTSQVCKNPQCKISDIHVLSKAQKEKLLKKIRSQRDLPGHKQMNQNENTPKKIEADFDVT